MEIERDWDGIDYTNNCAAKLIMKNGDVWFRTRRELKQIKGVGVSEFKFEDVVGIDFVKVSNPMADYYPNIRLESVDFHPYVNVEEINFKGIAYFFSDPMVDAGDFFPKLKKITFDEEFKSLNLQILQNNTKLQKIGFPQQYYLCACRFENSKFPDFWSKDLQIDLVAHYPKLVDSLTYMTEEECAKMYDAVCDEAIKRAKMQIGSTPKQHVIRKEAENLALVQNKIKEFKVVHDDVEKSLSDLANSNGFIYSPKEK